MPFVPVEDVARVAIVFQDTSGNEAVNVLHFINSLGGTTTGRLNTLATLIETWLFAEWAPTAAIGWSAVRLEIRDLTEAEGLYQVVAIDVPGTDDGQALPSQNTIAISLRSNFVGRSRRGRLYHVGLSENAVNGDYLIGTSRTVLIDAYEALRTASDAADWNWVVISYVADGAPRANPLLTLITSITITDDVIDSMDKRKPKS